MTAPPDSICDWQAFDQVLAQTKNPLPLFRQQLKTAKQALAAHFAAGAPVEELVAQHSDTIDQLLTRAWQAVIAPQAADIALVAVGGYGRGELHPHSDIDILVLLSDEAALQHHTSGIEPFLMSLWDMGLEVGHSARTVAECISQATGDITIATNLMEARLITGPQALFDTLKEAVGPDRIWPSRDFFRAKRDEQIARHHRFHDTAYNLEPNIKENPGGLRDLQVIGWVAKRHFGVGTLHDLVAHQFLTEHEYHGLMAAQNFLWRIRFALHTLTGRGENRLLFDHQRVIAEQFGYSDEGHRLPVEHFMKDYYRTVQELSRLNEMLLQLFEEEILLARTAETPTPLNEHFQASHGYLEVVDADVFKREPSAILELFLVMARQPQLRGVRANTIRLIRDHRYLIDDDFRHAPRCHELFIGLFRQGTGLSHELHRMNRYGVLAAYLPVFGRIVGQMQHDLFHVYTVDEHTLFVVRNLRRFTVPGFFHEFPLCSRIIQKIEGQEVLTLAGLFHDIAKGRGGNHSELGASDAEYFCRQHGMGEHDTALVKWLVKNHLIMSTTAQRKDISDPDVITAFAEQVGSQKRLDHLYLLTVADIRATSPDVWNSWKDALLADLYRATSRALRRGLDNPLEQDDLIAETQSRALAIIEQYGFSHEQVNALWGRLDADYFLRHSADEIAWHSRGILTQASPGEPLVLARAETHRGGTEIFVYTDDRDYLFAVITAALEQLGLDITDARITTSDDHHALDTFLVLGADGEPITETARLEEIQTLLKERFAEPALQSRPIAHMPRQLKHFPIETEVLFRQDPYKQRTILEVVAGDRPGLLARIARALMECNILLQNAKIATFGERAEDIFFITDNRQQPLRSPAQFDCLQETIKRLLAY
jgi:[protein-PII] uridylyltransferase